MTSPIGQGESPPEPEPNNPEEPSGDEVTNNEYPAVIYYSPNKFILIQGESRFSFTYSYKWAKIINSETKKNYYVKP